jgi:hypothetical protein
MFDEIHLIPIIRYKIAFLSSNLAAGPLLRTAKTVVGTQKTSSKIEMLVSTMGV